MRLLVILLIIGGVGYYWHYKKERLGRFESLEREVRSVQQTLTQKEKDRDKVLEKLEPLRRAKAEAEGTGTSVEQLQEEVAAMQSDLSTATAQLDAAEAEFVREMEAVRVHAKTKTFPAIKLASGDELLECSITKFGEGYISITHKDGIQKVGMDDLPEGWVARYSLDYVSRDSDADKEALAAKVEEITFTDGQLKAMKLGDLDEKIRALDAQLLALSQQVREKSRRSDQLQRDAYRIILRGGKQGQTAQAQRTQLFNESKKQEGERELIRAQYRKLREQKVALEKRRTELKYSRN